MLFPKHFTAEGIHVFVIEFNTLALGVYFSISLIRGLFLIPSTPFVLAGALLFPTNLSLVFVISMLGIMGSGTFIYHAAHFLDFSEKRGEKINRLNEKIRRSGFWIVLTWSFFPLVPTDLICWVAGRVRIAFWKYILALFIGEAVLVAIYLTCYQYFLN